MTTEAPPQQTTWQEWRLPILLFGLTCLSTLAAGAMMEGVRPEALGAKTLLQGWPFALPLMSILLAHEMGHYIAGRIHQVDISPPYFIPMPMVVILGTMGAVIRMRGKIRTRNALLDIGAAGPIAGLVVALPVLVYGIMTSPVEALPETGNFLIEGRNLLYLGMLYVLKGPIPDGHDIMLNSTAFAGWAGLLVTQINLLPVGQLDGGHVAYALFGKTQDRYSKRIHGLLPLLALFVSLAYTLPGYLAGERGEALDSEIWSGAPWFVWFIVLSAMHRLGGSEHPPTGETPLSPKRRWIAIGSLILFVLLFMPSWLRPG